MKYTLHYSNNPPFVSTDHKEKGLGGTENFACYVATGLAKLGHEVTFYNQSLIPPTKIDGVTWANLRYFDPTEPCDALISFRMREVFKGPLATSRRILILADTESAGLGDDVRGGRITKVMSVSKWQQNKIAQEEGLIDHPAWMDGSNGIDADEFVDLPPKNRAMCIHLSTPERGLGFLLDIWPDIERHTNLVNRIQPELHLFSSFMGWGVTLEDNAKMCEGIYARIEELQSQGYHIVNHIHGDRDTLRAFQKEAALLLYPTNFNETYCISLTECMAAGCVPIVSNRGALPNRVTDGVNGYLVGDFESDASTLEHKTDFVETAVTALWVSDAVYNRLSAQARERALQDSYQRLVPLWAQIWGQD